MTIAAPCPDCAPFASGWRESAIGYLDGDGREHRAVRVCLCECEAGAERHRRATTAAAKEGASLPHTPVGYRNLRKHWHEVAAAKGWTITGWWVTSRELRMLPGEARLTPAEMARLRARAEAPVMPATAAPPDPRTVWDGAGPKDGYEEDVG